jgi:ATP-binding cassette subfamily B multidrug efflux pump
MWPFIRAYPLRYWGWYSIGLITLVITTVVTTWIPLTVQHIIDAIHSNATWIALRPLVLNLIGLAILLAIFRTLSRILIFTPGRYVEYDLRRDLHAHLLTLPPSFFRTHTIGDTMSRVINDIQALRLMSAFGLLHIANTSLIYGFVITQMAAINGPLTLWVMIPVPFALIMIQLFVKKLYQFTKESQERLGHITDFFVESIANMSVIKSFNAESPLMADMAGHNVAYRDTQLSLARIRSSMFPFIATIGAFGQVILLYKGGQLVVSSELTIGELVAFSNYLVLLAWPTAAFSWIISIVQRGMASLHRINDILNTPSPSQAPYTARFAGNAPPDIRLTNLSFSYPHQSQPALRAISLHIQPGQRIGIFGPTGSGKSTLAHLLAHIEPAPKGTLWFDGIDTRDYAITSLRQHIAMVPQRRFLFSTTIQDTILFADPSAPLSVAETAAKKACVYDDIMQFPQQWGTLVGEKGIMVSGGQQHRLALARAYASDYQLLILDDVLSSVDHDTEARMIQALNASATHATVLIISHRVSALKNCDWIIVLDAGQITHQGTHDTLLASDNSYKTTWHYQQMETDLLA